MSTPIEVAWLPIRERYQIFADYHQFCLKADESLDAPENFTDKACHQRVLTGPGVLTLMPERNMTVPVTLEVVIAPPPLDLVPWDHVVEASLDLGTGTLVVTNILGPPTVTLTVTSGPYRVRFAGTALGSLSFNGLDGDDSYAVTLWPSPLAEVAVLKQYGE